MPQEGSKTIQTGPVWLHKKKFSETSRSARLEPRGRLATRVHVRALIPGWWPWNAYRSCGLELKRISNHAIANLNMCPTSLPRWDLAWLEFEALAVSTEG